MTKKEDKYTENEELKLKFENVIATGIWIETFGQFLKTIGVTQQVSAINEQATFKAQEFEIIGGSLRSFVHALEAIGGIEILQEEKQTDILNFIPKNSYICLIIFLKDRLPISTRPHCYLYKNTFTSLLLSSIVANKIFFISSPCTVLI